MPKLLGNWLIAGTLSIITATIIIGWLDNVEESLLMSAAGAEEHPGIEKVDIEFGKRTILLSVYLSRPLSCAQVISALGVESLPIKEKVYTPTCQEINSELIKITYTEYLTV